MKSLLLAFVALLPGTCSAQLVITFQQTPQNGVMASWIGLGTMSGFAGFDLDFLNLIPQGPYNSGISGGPQSFALDSPLVLTGYDVTGMNSVSYTNLYSSVRLNNGANFDNLVFEFTSGNSLSTNDTYNTIASGSALVQGLSFSSLNPGTYTSDSNDAINFGGVTLNVVAIPEGNGIVFVGLAMCTTGLIFYGRQYMASRKAAA